jgi:hypothetical protein
LVRVGLGGLGTMELSDGCGSRAFLECGDDIHHFTSYVPHAFIKNHCYNIVAVCKHYDY